jgi:hypothetical protein
VLLIVMSACGSESATTPAYPADDVAKAPVSVPVAELPAPIDGSSFAGNWEGILSCAGRDFPTRLELTAQEGQGLSGRWTIEPALGRGRYISPDGRSEIRARKLRGVVEPITGLATLEQEVDSPPLAIELLFSGGAALLAYQTCDFGLIMPAPAAPIDAIKSELVLLQQPVVIEASDQEGKCPADLENWIGLGLALPLDARGRRDLTPLWSAESTAPIFGEPVATLTAARRVAVRRALQGRCGVRGDRERNAIVDHLATITDLRSFRNSTFAARSRAVADAWLESRARPVLGADPVPGLEQGTANALSRIPRAFAFDRLFSELAGYNARDYANRLVAINETLAERRRLQDYLANMRSARFFKMQELWFAALARGDVDDEAATQVAMERLLPTAVAFAEAADDARRAREMAAWVAAVESNVLCNESTRRRCQEAAAIFTGRLDVLAAGFAALPAQELKALAQQEKTLPTLEALIASDRRIEQTYGYVLAYGAFPRHMDERADLRHALQRELEPALAAQLAAAGTTSALRELETRYFDAADLRHRPARHLRRLGEVYDQQQSGTRPFSGTDADDYLNALYNREFSTLARLDAELLAGVLPLYGFMASQIETLAGLMGGAGRPLQSAALELRSPSAATAVALRYLLAYGDRYAACLGPDAATVTFTERVDTVTRTSGGIELRRLQGVPVATHYRIKRAHLELFSDVFSRPETPGAGKNLETLLGLDGVTRLTDAVDAMMADYPCDAEAVKGFEQGLVAYYDERKRGWGR